MRPFDAKKAMAETEFPAWAGLDAASGVRTAGTGLKLFSGRAHPSLEHIWVLQMEGGRVYKDRFGKVSVSWRVNPHIEGGRWVASSTLSFAPATSGSFANGKFGEFRDEVRISGKAGAGVFGIAEYTLTVTPGTMDPIGDVNALVARHAADLDGARRWWKKQLVEAKRMSIASEGRDMNGMAVARELVAVARDMLAAPEGGNSLDGMSKVTAKRHVNKLLFNYTRGFFRDEDWRNIDVLFKAMTAGAIDWTLTKTEYLHNNDGVPSAKIWQFDVDFTNERGRPAKLYGIITASGAGSVENPLERYDITAYVS